MTPNLSTPPQWANMFWDLVTLLAFIGTWVYLMTVNNSLIQLRTDVDDVLMFNRISRYHALNDEVIKQKEEEKDGR